MATGAAALAFAIRATNEAKAALNDAAADLKKVGDAADKAHPSMKKVGDESEKAGGHLTALKAPLSAAGDGVKTMGGHLSGLHDKLGTLAPALVGFGGALTAAFTIKGALGEVSELGTQVGRLQREFGGSAEDVSKLTFALNEKVPGGADAAEKSLLKLSKALAGMDDVEDGVVKSGSAVVKAIEGMGIKANGADGQIKPMNQMLSQLADKFKAMPDGADKTALSMQIFGKSGADMLPFLNQGSAGLAALSKKAEEFGLVLDDKTLKAMKEQKLATKEMGAAFDGIKLQIGIALVPVMTYFAKKATELAIIINHEVVPAIRAGSEWIGKNLVPAIQAFLANDAVPMLKSFGETMRDVIVPAAMQLAETIGDKLSGPMERLMELLGGKQEMLRAAAIVIGVALVGAFTAWAVSAASAAVATIIAVAPVIAVVAAVALLAAGVYLLVKHWDDIVAKYPIVGAATDALKEKFLALVDWFKGPFAEGVQKVYDVTAEWVGKAVAWVKEHWDEIKAPFVAFGDWVVSDFVPFVKKVYDVASEWIGKAIAWVKEHWDEIKAPFVAFGEWVVSDFVPFWVKVYTAVFDEVSKAIDYVVQHWDGIKAPFVAFGEWVTSTYVPFWVEVYSTVAEYAKKAIDFVVDHWDEIKAPFVAFGGWITETYIPFWVLVYSTVYDNVKKAIDWVVEHFDEIKAPFETVFSAISGIFTTFISDVQTVIGWIQSLIDKIKSIPSPGDALGGFGDFVGDHIHGRASGGPVSAGSLYMVGERGPELFIPSVSGKIANNAESRQMASGVTVNVLGDQHFYTPADVDMFGGTIGHAISLRRTALGAA